MAEFEQSARLKLRVTDRSGPRQGLTSCLGGRTVLLNVGVSRCPVERREDLRVRILPVGGTALVSGTVRGLGQRMHEFGDMLDRRAVEALKKGHYRLGFSELRLKARNVRAWVGSTEFAGFGGPVRVELPQPAVNKVPRRVRMARLAGEEDPPGSIALT